MSDLTPAVDVAASLIKPFEGLHKLLPDGKVGAYMCPAGYPTQGWGIVVPSLQVPPITREQADARLAAAIPKYMRDALKLSPGLAADPRRLGAITSFVFNLGAGRYRASTLRRRVNEKDWPEAKRELMRWTRGGGRVLRGLVLRRAAEAAKL
jgi:lysozyme